MKCCGVASAVLTALGARVNAKTTARAPTIRSIVISVYRSGSDYVVLKMPAAASAPAVGGASIDRRRNRLRPAWVGRLIALGLQIDHVATGGLQRVAALVLFKALMKVGVLNLSRQNSLKRKSFE